MEHCKLVRIPFGKHIHDVKCEVEGLGILECNLLGSPLLVQFHIDVIVPESLAVIDLALLLEGYRRIGHGGQLGNRSSGGIEDYGVELAVLSVDGNHAVRRGGAEVDTVSGTQRGAVLAHLNQKVSGNDQVKLLAVVTGQLYVPVLGILVIAALYIERLGNPVLEGIGKVVISHAVGVGDLLTASGSGYGEGLKRGAVTFDDIGYVNAQRQCAAVDEREVQIPCSGLAGKVLFPCSLGLGGHLVCGKALDFPQFLDSRSHFLDFVIQACNLCHIPSSTGIKKYPSHSKQLLETSM